MIQSRSILPSGRHAAEAARGATVRARLHSGTVAGANQHAGARSGPSHQAFGPATQPQASQARVVPAAFEPQQSDSVWGGREFSAHAHGAANAHARREVADQFQHFDR